jgi:hypothetical protein
MAGDRIPFFWSPRGRGRAARSKAVTLLVSERIANQRMMMQTLNASHA